MERKQSFKRALFKESFFSNFEIILILLTFMFGSLGIVFSPFLVKLIFAGIATGFYIYFCILVIKHVKRYYEMKERE